MPKKSTDRSGKKTPAFRVGRVRVYLRGQVWYLSYHEGGKRKQPRVGPSRDIARQMAAEINAQLEVGVPSSLGFEPITIVDLRQRWLEQHEHVRRSSLPTIRRYQSATAHLIDFVTNRCPIRRASDFRSTHAEQFVRYLRSLRVAANGHTHSRQRRLLDSGIRYILLTCSTMFNYAERHRHLPPYVENPFRAIEVGRIRVEDAKPIEVFDHDSERRLLEACDEWQFPVFLTLLMTGMRPGELALAATRRPGSGESLDLCAQQAPTRLASENEIRTSDPDSPGSRRSALVCCRGTKSRATVSPPSLLRRS
ncbi:hypothetical protein [Rubinisphaera margarita]|uniref:hypothetical protein n=1 Tax=Rubinisphaera margarita TaxID=2909586 RepID=UPI001EE9A706|nr:hypothetical protein [Rubinisphaera margarita]MCG6157702.1 hypothetical protein [Rubinisphaera margarita]